MRARGEHEQIHVGIRLGKKLPAQNSRKRSVPQILLQPISFAAIANDGDLESAHFRIQQPRSLVVPLASDQDYTLHQYSEAEQVILGKLRTAQKPTRILEAGVCARAGGFLDAVAQLAEGAVRAPNPSTAGSTKSLCYIYDS
jgi:hypothetical protein